MALAIYGLIAALFTGLSGNVARLLDVLGRKADVRSALLVPAFVGQLAIIGLLLLAGAAITPVLGHELARAAAAGLLAVTVFLVLKPYALVEPAEPTRSGFAIGLVAAAFAIRDGVASLALALGLIASDFTGLAAGLAMGTGVAAALALRGGAEKFGVNARYGAATVLAAGAFYFGAFAQ